MTCHIVTEGKSDIALLQALLKPEFVGKEIDFMDGGGWSGADSLARSILAARREPVALVVDADSNDPRDRKMFLEQSLGQVGKSPMWKVFVAVPTIEGLFFEDKATLEYLIGGAVSEEQFIRGQYEPKRILGELLKAKRYWPDFLKQISDADLSKLRDTELIRELREFLGKAVRRAA